MYVSVASTILRHPSLRTCAHPLLSGRQRHSLDITLPSFGKPHPNSSSTLTVPSGVSPLYPRLQPLSAAHPVFQCSTKRSFPVQPGRPCTRPPSLCTAADSIVLPCHPRDARASRSALSALRASRCQTRGEKTAMRLSRPTRRTTGWQVRAHANGWRAASPRIGASCAAANLLSPARQCSRPAAIASTVIA